MQSLSLGEDYGNWSMETVASDKVPLYIACALYLQYTLDEMVFNSL